MSFLDIIETAASEVPDVVGQALKMMGDEIAKMGELLQALADRMDKLDHQQTPTEG